MQIHYLEIVALDVEKTCRVYERVHAVTFSVPDASLGGARTAELIGGGRIGVRAPIGEEEQPVVRAYALVGDIEEAVAAALSAGAEILHPPLEIAGLGKFAIYAIGGNQLGFWQK